MNHELEYLIGRMMQSGFSFGEVVRLTKRACLREAMVSTRGNQCHAALAIGVHRNTISRLLKEAQLDPGTGKPKNVGSATRFAMGRSSAEDRRFGC